VASGKPVEVEDVFDATEAVWARRSESSRVRRLTTASCSFSSCMWRSAAVSGRGCRSGPVWYRVSETAQTILKSPYVLDFLPGPTPTPVLSAACEIARGSLEVMVGGCVPGGEVGGGIDSWARRRKSDGARRGLYGEGGREFRSGAMLVQTDIRFALYQDERSGTQV